MRATALGLALVLAVGVLGLAGDGSVVWAAEGSYGCTPCQQGDDSLSGADTYCYVLNCWCASVIYLCCQYWCWTGWSGYTYTECTFVPWCDPDWQLPYWVLEITPV